MKVKTMRERLHEAIDLANDEKIITTFRTIPLEISRSKQLTLMQIQELIREAEEEFDNISPEEELEAAFKRVHRSFFAIIREKDKESEAASA